MGSFDGNKTYLSRKKMFPFESLLALGQGIHEDATSLVDFVDSLSSLESVVAFFFFCTRPPWFL